MRNGLFLLLVLILLVFSAGCEASLPDLPEMEESMDVDIFEIGDEDEVKDAEANQDEDAVEDEDSAEPQIKASHVIVAEVGGYDVPMSGKVFYAENENLNDFREVPVENGMGSPTGADLNLAVWQGGFVSIGRHDSSSLYFFGNDFEFNKEIKIKSDIYINMQDVVYNSFKDEFIISALSSNKLILLKNDFVNADISELELSKNELASPAKMRIIGGRLFVALQNLDERNLPDKGEVAVVNLEDYSVKLVSLPKKNPTGKIEYNAAFDTKHIYFVATGEWQKRDGALLQMDLETYETKVVLSESEEENNILDGDFVDVTIADNGEFYIIFSNNSSKWENNLLKYLPGDGIVSKIDSNINAFAANPIDFSPMTGRIYYFVDIGSDTYLKCFDTKTAESETVLLDSGPAALRVKLEIE
ncbi:hypothetical protein J6Z19_00985 [bacterium]|nr:hypothetical protein [bacterium]